MSVSHAALLFVLATATPAFIDVLVVCPEAWRPAMDRWAAYREAEGHRLEWATPGEALTKSVDSDSEPAARTLILVGDGVSAGVAPALSSARIIAAYGPEASIATDHVLAERLGASVVARWPFESSEALRTYADRVIERSLAARPGADRIRIAAGVGGFSPWIDAAIESAARRLITDLSPEGSRVTLTRYPPSERSSETARERGGVWVWLGHGMRDALPGVDLDRLIEATGGADVAVLLACYAGDFAAAGECVAERLLADQDGPLAVVASTRVSMPYGNARLGAELLAEMQRGPATPVGVLFAAARTRSTRSAVDPRLDGLDDLAALLGGAPQTLPAERREHAQMYHLLGDPFVVVGSEPATRVAARPTATR